MYGLWFANIPGITPVKRRRIVDAGVSARELYGMCEERIAQIYGITPEDASAVVQSREHWNLKEEWMKLSERGIGFVTAEDAGYPDRLRSIHNPPYALYYIGKLPDIRQKCVAIVGARGRSAYGSQIAEQLGSALARAGVAVVSGMALGIDADGHTGALRAQGATYAVLGCGVDVCYPRQNRYLYGHIPACGGVISEYPIGTAPNPAFFPQRNRIIAGLADCTVVIEARKRSGSLITADYALEQGREVYALPGRITDELSQGCNQLLRQGAGVFTGVEDFVSELLLTEHSVCVPTDFKKNLLEKEESLVYSLFDFAQLGLGTLVEQSSYGLSELLPILERLEQKGFIKETIPNYYIKTI